MAKTLLSIAPGVSTVKSPLEMQGRIVNCNLIRFFNGKVQKRGGWTAFSPFTIAGTARGLHAWNDLQSLAYVAIGTEQLLQLLAQGQLQDIAPVVQTSNLQGAFSTVTGSPIVTINDPNHVPSVGDWITVATAIFVGGLFIQGDFQVQTIGPGANQYQVKASANATATVNNDGSVISFATTNGSNIVTITLGAFVFANGQFVTVYVPTNVGGLTIAGPFQVTLQGGNATIIAPGVATGNANAAENGGRAQILYPIPALLDSSSPFSFGAGQFGAGPFGVGSGNAGAVFTLREWSLDNFGQILVASPKGGAIYSWTPPVAYNNRATILNLGGAPQFSQSIFVAMPQEQLISVGSDGGGFEDPMLIRFCDIGNLGAWTASATNQAGSFRLTRGSRIVAGMQAIQRALVWTDVGLWSMIYEGFPFVYGFEEVGQNCGLIAMRAAGSVAGKVVWPSYKGFFMYDGSAVVPVPCEVWSQLFDQIDPQFINTLSAFPNGDFNEIAWHYPVLGSGGVPTNYISLNVGMLNSGYPPEQCWDFGVLTRTSGIDRSGVGPPLGADGANGLIQAHETGTDANGTSMPSFAETGWYHIENSDESIHIERLIPDIVGAANNPNYSVKVTVTLVEGESPTAGVKRVYGPFTATQAIEHLIIDGRGRFIKLRFDFSALGTFARVGSFIARQAPAGRG